MTIQEQLMLLQSLQQPQQMKFGGQVGAAVAGLGKAGASLLPGPLGGMAKQGIDTIHGALDKNITDEERSIMGYGQAVGGIGTAIATGGASLATGGLGDITQGAAQGITAGNELGAGTEGMINFAGNLGGQFGGMTAGNIGNIGASTPSMKADGGLVEFNNGGSHEQNPNGGVPFGPNASVEEGETAMSLDDMSKFVFSDRLKKGGKSFADHSKKINKKYKDREGDAAATRAKNKELKGLAQEQEDIKTAKMAKLQSKMEELNPGMAGMPGAMAMGGKIQYGNGGRVVSGFNLPQGLAADQIGAFQQYALTQGANLGGYGQNGVDNVYGNLTNNAWQDYGQGFLSSSNQSANPNAVPATPNNPFPAMNQPGPLATPTTGTAPGMSPEEAEIARILAGQGNANPSGLDIGVPGASSSDATGTGDPTADGQGFNWGKAGAIGGAQLLNSAGDIYGLVKGLQGPDSINYDRLDPNLVNLANQRKDVRDAAAGNTAALRENLRNQGVGGALAGAVTGAAAIDRNVGSQLSQSWMNQENANAQILNATDARNQQISTQEAQDRMRAQAMADMAVQTGLHGLGANTAQGIKDYRQEMQVGKNNQTQLNALNSMLGNFQADEKGNINFKQMSPEQTQLLTQLFKNQG